MSKETTINDKNAEETFKKVIKALRKRGHLKQGLSQSKDRFYIEGISPDFKTLEELLKWLKKKYANRKTKKSSK